ncbi:hypothetical protein DJFAAGMI_01294 [Comamonas sp. PE63]|uniref:Uncharacterized protein n=1 Tax=Comamonas brasiliensis TaxID=1812482 RepID=A0ABS5LR74_9BURK|nr:hypothetical protein [Comamonas sp. PE63]
MSIYLRTADAAPPDLAPDVKVPIIKCNLPSIVEAWLTQIVERLRRSWLAVPVLTLSEIHSIRQVARGDFDERVATPFTSGFFKLPHFLTGFEVFALELKKSSVVSKQSLLGFEQLIEQRRSAFVDQCRVAQSTHALGDVARSGN